MLVFFKFISSSLNSVGQVIIKHLGFGRSDVQESRQLAPYGVDSRPIKDVTGVRADTSEKGVSVILGYVNKSGIAEDGELRLYSTDSTGAEQSYAYLTKAGDLELNGNDDNAVRFSELEKGYNDLKADLNAFITAYNSHIHITTATVGPSTTPGVISATTSTAQTSTASIELSKVENVKLPK